MRLTKVLAGLVCVAACGGGSGHLTADDVAGDDAPTDGRVLVAQSNYAVNRSLDILLVIDDSPSMADKQQSLANELPQFINALATLPGGLPDVHIGVVTTDLGTKTAGDPTQGPTIGTCSGNGKGGNLQISGAAVVGAYLFDIEQTDGTRTKNYDGTLDSALSTMVKVGAQGCGFEQPLAAMRAALASNAQNAGFLRTDANLAVVILSDEDDCSAEHSALFGPESGALGTLTSFRCTRFGVTCSNGGATTDAMSTVGLKTGCAPSTDLQYVSSVSTYVDFLRGLKATGDKQLSVSVIAGPPTPFSVEQRVSPGGSTPEPALAQSCIYQGAMGPENADPAVRLAAFADAFGDHGSFGTVCGDFGDQVATATRSIRLLVGTTCIEQPLAGSAPAYDCIVEDITSTGTATTLPNCSAVSTTPCWTISADAVQCPVGQHLSVTIDRDGIPAAGSSFRARCTLAP